MFQIYFKKYFLQKIEQLESEIQKRKHQLALYKKKAEKIEKKVE